MADDMSSKQVSLTLIVAATTKNGIGKDGALPWPMLKREMAYFARVTKRVPQPIDTGSLQSDTFKQTILEGTRRNAVIMGRKTWESIPLKFRPLKDRTNIVISSQHRDQLSGMPDEVIVSSDISLALQAFDQSVKDGQNLPLGRAFVIGGSSIYKAAMELEQTKHMLLTRIQKDYECDAFFPSTVNDQTAAANGWSRRPQSRLSEFVGEDVAQGAVSESAGGEEVQFEYQLYERP